MIVSANKKKIEKCHKQMNVLSKFKNKQIIEIVERN